MKAVALSRELPITRAARAGAMPVRRRRTRACGWVVATLAAALLRAGSATAQDVNPYSCSLGDISSETVVVVGVDPRFATNPRLGLPYSPTFDSLLLSNFLFGPNLLMPDQTSFASNLLAATDNSVAVDSFSKAGGWYYMPVYGLNSGHLTYYCPSSSNGLGTSCYAGRIVSDTFYSIVVGTSRGPKVATDITSALTLAHSITHAILVVGGLQDDGVFLAPDGTPVGPVIMSAGKENLFRRFNDAENQDPTFATSAGATLLPYYADVSDVCASWSIVTAVYFRDHQQEFMQQSMSSLYLCGNGVLEPGEQCDDGNNVNGDGCSAACQIETGWTCAGQPASCTLAACPANAGGAPTCTCNSGYTGTLTWDGSSWTGACVDLCAGVTCTASDQCHVAGTCDPGTGLCSNPNASDGTPCNDGDGCPGDTCGNGVCQPVACPNVDAVVLVPSPVNIVIPPTKTEVDKTLAVTVRNADKTDRTILLQVDATACPPGSVGAVDFGGGQNSILVKAGKTKKASVPLTIDNTEFTSFNFKAPTRCTLVFTASAVVNGGSNDPNPSNNQAVVELNVVDKHDSEQTVRHETTIKSAAPTTVTIARKAATATKKLTAVVGNADYRPKAENLGDLITLQKSASCSGVTLSPPVCDPIAGSATATIKGGATKTCKLTATIDPTLISTPNKLSPQRCMVTLTAVGPTNPELAPLDPSNTSTELTIDIIDSHDF